MMTMTIMEKKRKKGLLKGGKGQNGKNCRIISNQSLSRLLSIFHNVRVWKQ